MLYLQSFVLLVLISIAWQDFKLRAVYWLLFLSLLIALASAKLMQTNWSNLQNDFIINSTFLIAQIVFLSLYFSIKMRKAVNIFKELFGFGDLLFLLSLTVYLSFFNYLLFYLLSLFTIIIISLILQVFIKNLNPKIPLAGKQAVLFSLFMIIDQLTPKIDLTSDVWLVTYLQF